MIKELGRKTEANWYEKIQLEMSLQDLQIIFDCIGAVPTKYFEIKHKCTAFNRSYDVYRDLTNGLYEDLEQIISEHNGVTDNDIMVDTDIELKIIN